MNVASAGVRARAADFASLHKLHLLPLLLAMLHGVFVLPCSLVYKAVQEAEYQPFLVQALQQVRSIKGPQDPSRPMAGATRGEQDHGTCI